ncbi:anti-sigma factor [Nocardioides yefusunii]|uniref:Regulator of SigK n=1 Tax=Nocardioides yefusunii TaxID=2500546 RepID=A0ABW1R1W4_9ACTN|nr:anti-sigma factor [Nocardioides yefusunii]
MNDIHLLTGAYVLDALDPLEDAEFESHLTRCPDCAEEITSFMEVTARLAASETVAPPAALRAQVLGAISTVRPLPPLVPEPADTFDSPAEDGQAHDVVVPLAPRARRRRFVGLVAAAAVVVAGVGVTVWSPWKDEPTRSVTELVLVADDAQREFVDLGAAGRATVIRSVTEDRAVLVTEDMVAPPEGSVYQVWLQTPADDMVPAAVMDVVPDQTILLDGAAGEAIGVGITVEPVGGSAAPTSDPIVLFDLSDD